MISNGKPCTHRLIIEFQQPYHNDRKASNSRAHRFPIKIHLNRLARQKVTLVGGKSNQVIIRNGGQRDTYSSSLQTVSTGDEVADESLAAHRVVDHLLH